MKILRKHVLAALVACSPLAFVSCGEEAEDEAVKEELDPSGSPFVGGASGGVTSGDDIVLSGQLNLTGATLLGSVTDLELFCVTFEETPRSGKSSFDEEGNFSVTMYANVNFGCFVNNKESNATVGSFLVGASSTSEDGLAGGESSSMALNQSLDLGDLTLGEDGKVVIPAAVIEKAISGVTSTLSPDDIHDNFYTMTCQEAGVDAARLAACKEFLEDDEQFGVYLRIVKASEGDNEILGLGVWEDKTSFTACGGVDFSTATKANIESEDGISFTQGDAGDFTPSAACPLRQDNDEDSTTEPTADQLADMENSLEKYYAFGKLTPTGAGFSFNDEDTYEHEECKGSHSTSIEFTGVADKFIGAFIQAESRSGCGTDENGESQDGAKYSVFNVTFTKVAE